MENKEALITLSCLDASMTTEDSNRHTRNSKVIAILGRVNDFQTIIRRQFVSEGVVAQVRPRSAARKKGVDGLS